MNLISFPKRVYRFIQRIYHSYKVQRCVELGRDLMTKGEFGRAQTYLVKAQKFDVGFSPRDALLLSFCLFYQNKNMPAYRVALAVEESIRRDGRRYKNDEVEYLIAYSRFIRNTCASRLQDDDLSLSPIDMSGIDLREVSDDLLATFPLVQHPDWSEFGWRD